MWKFIIVGGLAVFAFTQGVIEWGIIFSIVFVIMLWAKNQPDPPPPDRDAKKPKFAPGEENNFNSLFASVANAIQFNAPDFEYLYYQYSGEKANNCRMVGLTDSAIPTDYIPGQCVVAVRPNGLTYCYNFKQKGNFSLSEKSRAYLAWKLAQRFNAKKYVTRADTSVFYPTVFNMISDSADYSEHIEVTKWVLLSAEGQRKHEAELARQKAERDSIRHC